MDTPTMALWGLAGAFIYAGPRFVVSWYDPVRENGRVRAVLELGVSMAFGPIAAAGFAPLVVDVVHVTHDSEHRAVCVVLGMIANPIAPAVVQLLGTSIIRRLGGSNMSKGS